MVGLLDCCTIRRGIIRARGVGAVDLYVWRVVASLPSAASQTPLPARINTYVWRMSFAPTVGAEERLVDRGGKRKMYSLVFLFI